MAEITFDSPQYRIKETKNLSLRIQWLRDYYFEGVNRHWNNEYTSWSTGTPWDFQYEELSFYIVPETYAFFSTFRASYNQTSTKIDLHPDFWSWSIAERKAWFLKQVMVHHLPQEILPGDLIAGARFNVMLSTCLNKKEAAQYHKRVHGKHGSRNAILWFHNHGYGNVGATSGHIIPDYETVLTRGWEGIYTDLQGYYQALSPDEQKSAKGAQMRAMMTAATLPKELAQEYSKTCRQLAESTDDPTRKDELLQMADILQKVPWKPAETFWEAVQSLWLSHMLVMSDENYPGPGVSFGRIDQLLYPMWQKSIQDGMDPETGKEILKCFWIHANTAYDGMIRTGGNQGITAGYGQLFTISGLGANDKDMTNDLTYVFLEVIDEMSPILEPKPNVRIHRNSPDELMDTLVEMVADSQGAPFILNFDERSIAGMLLQAEKANLQHLIHEDNVFEYAPVGCLENTMVGNDRSGTVDNNLNLLKAIELALTGGYDLLPFVDSLTGKTDPVKRDGPNTGDSSAFKSWADFWQAYVTQTRYIIQKIVDTYEFSESIRKQFSPTPYLSCMVNSCAKKGLDVTQGGADISLTTIEGVTFATTVDALLAIKHLVYDQKICTMPELIQALKDNWIGHEILQARALNKAPKYGRDDDVADALAQDVMQMWTDETWKHRTKSTNRRFRPGMLSWNYWVSDGFILPASADGRPKGKFLSNALCPSNGADTNGPTANVNSVGKALAGKLTAAFPNWQGFINLLPNGGSHTMTFNPSLLRDPEHKTKFKAFLKAYAQNGGTALQINILDAEMLRDAQRHPENYRNLLVRVTGYNAYFTSIGKELQDEIIARESHRL